MARSGCEEDVIIRVMVVFCSCGHLGAMLSHLGHSSAMLEMLFQAWELSTFSALPVPMLRQVYLRGQK